MEAAAASAPAPASSPNPFLGDDIFVLIAAELDARMLGRLCRAAQRFWRPSVPDPAHQGRAPAELWSVAEEGARRRLAAQSEQVQGWVCRGGVGGSWLRALGEAEKLQRPVRFTAHGETIELGAEGTIANLDTTAYNWCSAVCGGHEMRRGRHYATFTLRTGNAAMLGVVGVGFDLTGPDQCAQSSPQGWMLWAHTGELYHRDRSNGHWEGHPQSLRQGDVVVRLPLHPACTPTRAATAHGAVCGARDAGPAAGPRRCNPDGVDQRRAEGRHGPARHDGL
eukprot:COSAG04_NODE_779_length_10341_cov_3.429799_2_plen_280_part_00